MRSVALLLPCLLLLGDPALGQVAATGPDGSRIVVGPAGTSAQAGVGRRFDCSTGHLIVTCSRQDIQAAGTCQSVEVSGTGNTVHVQVAPGATISVSGSRNTVFWAPAVVNGVTPTVTQSGTANHVRQD